MSDISDAFKQWSLNADEGNLKSAFLNTVARNGWEHLLNKNAMPQEPVEFSWEVNLGIPLYVISLYLKQGIQWSSVILS